MMIKLPALLLILSVGLIACGQQTDTKKSKSMNKENSSRTDGLAMATFASGCFWCTEAIFLAVNGVEKVESGYMGGSLKNPSYKEVTSGQTGHAECIQLTYNPSIITYDELLEIFWQTHDPTTLNRQGADVGTQYRSAIFYHSEEQKQLAGKYKALLEEEKVFEKPIVTEITKASDFYVAEDYHQNYYSLNQNAPYCSYVIQPKLEKFKKVFRDKLKQ